MRYELYYWPTIQGRGEFVRLALEEAGADYVDVARRRGQGGVPTMMKFIDGARIARPPFAPPFLQGRQARHRPDREHPALSRRRGSGLRRATRPGGCGRINCSSPSPISWYEIHDTHHPVTGWLYYEEQRAAAKRRTKYFWRYRVPKFLGYFERVLEQERRPLCCSAASSAMSTSRLFQIVEGLRYAFPKRMKRFEKKCRGLSRCTTASPSARASRPISPRSGASRSASGASIATSRISTPRNADACRFRRRTTGAGRGARRSYPALVRGGDQRRICRDTRAHGVGAERHAAESGRARPEL